MADYSQRFAEAVRARLGDGVEVYADRSMVCLDEIGTNARALAFLPLGDHRRAVTSEDVADTLRTAARKLRSNIPHFKPEYVEPARAFADHLERVAS